MVKHQFLQIYWYHIRPGLVLRHHHSLPVTPDWIFPAKETRKHQLEYWYLELCDPKCGPWTGSLGNTWEPARPAESLLLPRLIEPAAWQDPKVTSMPVNNGAAQFERHNSHPYYPHCAVKDWQSIKPELWCFHYNFGFIIQYFTFG